MQNKKNQSNVTQMIQRCHKWRQKRKQLIDQARQISDEIERERVLQTAEHYGRIVNSEQIKIDSMRDPKDKNTTPEVVADTNETNDTSETSETTDDDEVSFPDFITNLN